MTEIGQASRLQYDTHSADDIRGYFESGLTRRSFNPLESELATEALKSQIDAWRDGGCTVVFTSGCYDLMHTNHRTYLLHTKLAASPYCWDKLGYDETEGEWADQTASQRANFSRWLLESDLLKQVVSIDGNASVAARKGFNVHKGGSPRPIFDWRTRARDVLSAGFELRPGLFKPIVDAVTLHDNVEPSLNGTPNSGILEIGEFVQPDVWSVFEESGDIISAAEAQPDRFNNTEFSVLRRHNYYNDALLDGTFSTTSIVKRLSGGVV